MQRTPVSPVWVKKWSKTTLYTLVTILSCHSVHIYRWCWECPGLFITYKHWKAGRFSNPDSVKNKKLPTFPKRPDLWRAHPSEFMDRSYWVIFNIYCPVPFWNLYYHAFPPLTWPPMSLVTSTVSPFSHINQIVTLSHRTKPGGYWDL